jgi:hypothetical protein
MNSKCSSDDSIFVPYDDNNIEHIKNGPDYGQVDGINAWNETSSSEYVDYISEIEEKIIKFSISKITPI